MQKTIKGAAALIMCIAIVLSFTVPASAASYNKTTDYMAVMINAVVTGNTTAGNAAAASRNAKITGMKLSATKISYEDLNYLAKIIYSEAGSSWLSTTWKMSVGEVVLNRVASSEYPNTVKGVITQKGQYSGATTTRFANLKPTKACATIAYRLLNGERVLNDKSVVYQSSVKQGSSVHTALYDRTLGWTYLCRSSKLSLYK